MAILQRPYAGQVKNLTPPAAGCGGWFLAVGGVICCGRWAAGLAGCGVGRCWRWAAGCCEVWQGVQAVQLCGLRGHRCGAGGAVGVGLLLAGGAGGRGDLLRRRGAGGVIDRAGSSLIRTDPAGDPVQRAGSRASGGKMGKRKRPGQTARRALLLWPLVCTGGAIRCAGCVPVQEVGAVPGYSVHFTRGGRAAPDPGATVPAGNVPAWHGLRWRCSIRVNFAVCRRGQILYLTGLRGRCRALT